MRAQCRALASTKKLSRDASRTEHSIGPVKDIQPALRLAGSEVKDRLQRRRCHHLCRRKGSRDQMPYVHRLYSFVQVGIVFEHAPPMSSVRQQSNGGRACG